MGKMKSKLQRIQAVFNELFSEHTILEYAATEPLYRVARRAEEKNILYSREEIISSALHEIAHWCIAGKERRLKDDFGYWYLPDGRTKEEQDAFFSVEEKPQALEWIFSLACKHEFHFSVDNLDGESEASEAFKEAVQSRYLDYFEKGLPKDAKKLYDAFSIEFANPIQIGERLQNEKTF